MKRICKLLSLILTVSMLASMLVGFVPANATLGNEAFVLPDIVDSAEAQEKGYVGRVKSAEKDLYTFIFANDDGTNTMRIYSHPVKYVADDGTVRDISLGIEQKRGGGFVTADHEIITTFESKLTDGISLEYDDIEIMLVPTLGLSTVPKAELSKDGKVVTYKMNDTTSFVYELTYAGFKKDIVVEKYTGQTEYTFTIFTNGLTLVEEDGSYYLADSEGNIEATVGDIIVFTADERNNTMGRMTYETVRKNQEYVLTIHLDAEYLADENTKYPIRIDPTIEVNYTNNGAGAIEDVTLNSTATSSATSTSLTIGLRNSYGIGRVLMRFPGLDMDDLPGEHLIIGASVEIRDLICQAEEVPVYCYIFEGNDWTESTASWDSVGTYDLEGYMSSKVISYANGVQQPTAHRYSFDISFAVRGWKSGRIDPDKGILFKASDAVETGSTANYKTIASYNRASYKPSLSVTYREIINIASVTTYPYNSSNRMLLANKAHRYAFTPSASGKYSFWTEGDTDTLIVVYSDSAYSNNIGIANDRGHGLNGCLTLSLTVGCQYYIFVRGSSTQTTGEYLLRISRGLPLSGSEQPSNFDIFNSSTYMEYTNCYTYALNIWTNPSTGGRFRRKGADPGELSNPNYSVTALVNPTTAKAVIESSVKADCVTWGGSEDDFYQVNEDTMVPEGYYKVALVLAPELDYHWYRQVSDMSGVWVHKKGATAATPYDESDELIYDPEEADRGVYTVFLGYYAIKPPSAYNS